MFTPRQKVEQNRIIEKAHGIAHPMVKRLYTVKEAAMYLGRSTWGVRELIWAGRIPVVRPEGRKIFLDILDLEKFIDQNKSTYL